MDRSQIFTKIQELSRENSKQEELRNFCKINIDKVLVDFPRRILRNDGGNLIDCIFKGLPDSNSLIKVKVIDKVLKTGREEAMSLTHCGDIISKVCLELPRMPVEHLVRWSSECVQSIIKDGDVNMIWKDILPESLNTVSTQNLIKHCGSEMTGEEFKIQCVHTLCQCRWTEKQLVQLAAMFKDLQLPKVEHKQVVNKICSYIVDLPPETLPPLVHQLLKLCKLYNTEVVLSHLSHYFNIRLYSKLEPPPQDSESTTIDMDDIVQYSHAELSRCLSTCLYHISQGVAEPELIRKHIKQWPKTQLLRAPFIIDLALAISDKGTDFRSVCMDIIKSAIELNILDKLRNSESSWVRSVLPPDVDVVNVLKVLTTESANHRQLTVLGLINLAFSLLSVSRIKPTAATCWSHGKLILVRLCKAQPETAGHILGQLSDRLFSDQNLPQYTDCLYILCKLTPVSIERSSQLITILENCQPLVSYEHSANTYEAVRPLIAFSARVRDVLVMVCRKGLYSRDSAYRCLALSGFLTVLRHIKLSKTLVMSQNNYNDDCSEHSYLTQIAVDMHSNSQGSTVTSRMRNEIICLEVVSILRRCLVQDALVKQLLYTEMYECAKEKPALHESILELFYEHLIKYLQEEEDNWQLLLDKCVQETPSTAILIEPIGRLLYAMAQFLQPIPDEDAEDCSSSQSDSSVAYLKTKLMDIMNKLCKFDLLTLINMEDIALTDLSPESKAKNLKVQQLMQCLEALIAHQILQWTPSSTLAESTHRLYKQHTQLLDNSKSSPKTKKTQSFNQTKEEKKNPKSTKKGKNTQANNKNKPITDSQETTISQNTQGQNKTPGNKRSLTQKSEKSQKSPKKKKMSNLMKDRAGPFKPLPCLWDMRLCLRILDLLYGEEVSWSSTEQRNYIRGKCDFHLYSIRNIQSVLGEKLGRKVVATHVLKISELLYNRCVCRFQDMCEFDERTTLACLELFKTSLSLLLSPNYSLKVENILSGITGITDKPESASLSDILEKLYNIVTYLETEAAEEDLDLLRKKILTVVLQIVSILLETPVLACSALNEVILKFEDYIRSSKQAESLQLLPALLNTAQRQQREATLLGQLLDKLTVELGVIDEEEESSPAEETTNFPTINSRSGHSVLVHVCVHLSSRFNCAEHLLNRARDLSSALSNAVHTHQQRIDKELNELYKSVVVELCQLGAWVSRAAALRCAVGAASERVLRAAVRLYALLAALLRQLQPATALLLRLDRLLKVTGKKLSAVIDSFITYMESSQDQQKASKVLRDTKLIPRLVLEAEQFSKHVLLLGSKAKINYKQYLSIGTARDFKIKAPVLQEFLNNKDATEQESESEETEEARENGEENDANNEYNINDAATEILSPVISDREQDDSDDEPPIIKKRKRRS